MYRKNHCFFFLRQFFFHLHIRPWDNLAEAHFGGNSHNRNKQLRREVLATSLPSNQIFYFFFPMNLSCLTCHAFRFARPRLYFPETNRVGCLLGNPHDAFDSLQFVPVIFCWNLELDGLTRITVDKNRLDCGSHRGRNKKECETVFCECTIFIYLLFIFICIQMIILQFQSIYDRTGNSDLTQYSISGTSSTMKLRRLAEFETRVLACRFLRCS